MPHLMPRRALTRTLALFIPLALLVVPQGAVAASPDPAAPAPAASAAAASRPSKQYTIEQFMATTSLRGASFSPSEDKILFSSNESGIFNVYSMPVGGGAATPLTRSTTDSTYAVSYFPRDERALITRDQGGNELNHLYVLALDGKEVDITPGEKLKAAFEGWARDLGGFYVTMNDRDPRFFDIYRFDAATYERKLLYKNETGYELGDISGDEKWMGLEKQAGSGDKDIYLLNVATGELKRISEHEDRKEYEVAQFDPASRWLYYLTNDGGEYKRVRRYELSSGRHEEVEKAEWDIEFTRLSYNGRYRVTGINADGTTLIRMRDAATGADIPLPKVPDGEIGSVTIGRSERRIVFYVNGDRSPNDLHVLDLDGASARRLTDSLSKEIDPEDLVDAQVVRFKSFDGVTIPNILYQPMQATPASRAPALVWVHGGPGGQTRRGYSALLQYLVNHGYVVLGINNRGSSGYGRTFYLADDRKHGREPLWDCVEAKKYLTGLPSVDSERIGIIGGSYGGYMVLAALTFKPDVFDVGVDIFGVSNWVRTLESIPPYWESIRNMLSQEIGDPAQDKQMLRDISPLFHADKIRRPLIVLQGANDPRVIKAESDDIVAAVRKTGQPVEYVIFADEGHGFSKKKNQIEGYGAVLRFLDEHLKGSAARSGGG